MQRAEFHISATTREILIKREYQLCIRNKWFKHTVEDADLGLSIDFCLTSFFGASFNFSSPFLASSSSLLDRLTFSLLSFLILSLLDFFMLSLLDFLMLSLLDFFILSLLDFFKLSLLSFFKFSLLDFFARLSLLAFFLVFPPESRLKNDNWNKGIDYPL